MITNAFCEGNKYLRTWDGLKLMPLFMYSVHKSSLVSYGDLLQREISHMSELKGET